MHSALNLKEAQHFILSSLNEQHLKHTTQKLKTCAYISDFNINVKNT